MLDDLARLPDLLAAVSRYAASALTGLPDRPAVPHGAGAAGPTEPVEPAEPAALPVTGLGFEGAVDLFARRWAPGFTASAGPRYLGFVTGGSTPAALAGDWLAAAFDQNTAASDGSAAPDLERETVCAPSPRG